ncbi:MULTISPECIES: hypothetical protein [unclassified Bradyrhizobium]|uniref:hypothetical protein n=1 Tax=unclassified Bradyrhizobium TaxID=2631580 RepID=UPI001BA555D5|nr:MULTISPECIES: hypothetical protein [unclassified Bradyrhizobium]MBR1229035.1 hypothetical protein [Bradyrhizobium sp. AUGA SZCCT0176]MBR1282175.1 hypothetical protein [Bradyrhizobium sp. AUGA SZCCT0177]MBR1299030.1 hypothetical protein [Bradyrhizobium sp. AUGA SZCCT0042]
MPHYRVYVSDEHGRLVGVVNFDCTDDDAAKERAKQLGNGHEVQLWRQVTQFKFENPPDRSKRRRGALTH